MKKSFLVLVLSILPLVLFSQGKPAYSLFSKNGKPAKWKQVIRKSTDAELIFFGEQHNDPIAHWLQLELLMELFSIHGDKLKIGAEMFESDNQLVIDEYMAGYFDDKKFEENVRLWPNYKTDYKPLLSYAHANEIPFIATNIPRRYANMVFREGLDVLEGLPDESKEFIAPLPIEFDAALPGYKNMLEMSGHSMSINFPKSQASKDATMAHFILMNMNTGDVFYHINGAYHSDNYEGIAWYTRQREKDKKILTISTVIQEEINSLSEESLGIADFIIVVSDRVTRTY
jgi:uncharacterized iron-regulated protein